MLRIWTRLADFRLQRLGLRGTADSQQGDEDNGTGIGRHRTLPLGGFGRFTVGDSGRKACATSPRIMPSMNSEKSNTIIKRPPRKVFVMGFRSCDIQLPFIDAPLPEPGRVRRWQQGRR